MLGKGNTATVKRAVNKTTGQVKQLNCNSFARVETSLSKMPTAGGSESDFKGSPQERAASEIERAGGRGGTHEENHPSELHTAFGRLSYSETLRVQNEHLLTSSCR